MTNEIEKTFFDTFGIEERCEFDKYCDDCKTCGCYHYPRITDRILLELMCIDFEENPYKCRGGVNITNVKEYILDEFIWGYKNDLYRDRQDIKHQVRTLFEEG